MSLVEGSLEHSTTKKRRKKINKFVKVKILEGSGKPKQNQETSGLGEKRFYECPRVLLI